MVQTRLMVAPDDLAFAASEHEPRACGLAGQGGVLREVVRRNHDTGVAPPEHADLVVQIFQRLRVAGRVALPSFQRLGAPVLGLRVPGTVERPSARRELERGRATTSASQTPPCWRNRAGGSGPRACRPTGE